MLSKYRKSGMILIIALLMIFCANGTASGNKAFEIRRVGNIHPYDQNAFHILAAESGILTIRVHDSICVYRTITERIPAGETMITWDGCGYNREKLYEKSYTITAELETDSGSFHSISFTSPIEYPMQCLQYALPSSEHLYLDNIKDWFLEYRTVTDGTIRIDLRKDGREEPAYSYTFKVQGGKIKRKDFSDISGKKVPETGEYTISVFEISRPEETFVYPFSVSSTAPERPPVTVTGEIMPDRTMTDKEIWNMMMKPSVVVDIDFFDHQLVFEKPDTESTTLGTLHGQTQCLKVIRIEKDWALVGAWNHENASYIEGWVPYSRLKTEKPKTEYGILIDKQKQTLSIYQRGCKIDTLLISTGRAEYKHLYQETSAGCFLTGYHRVNFSMNGKKYDYVIQYDGGNLLHQTPYDWGQQKKDFTLGRGYLGAKASHACIRIQPEPGEGGLNAFWLFTHIPYHTRVIILDDPEEREAMINRITRNTNDEANMSVLRTIDSESKFSDQTVTITFGGCLTPGGSRLFNSRKESFVSFVSNNGYQIPLDQVRQIFEEDDLSCVNLCGLFLTGAETKSTEKQPPSAPEETSEIFRYSSVEMIQMTSDDLWSSGTNHVLETEHTLQPFASVLNRENGITVSIKGHLFGFAGCSEKEYLKNPSIIDERINQMKEKHCDHIVFLASWGENSGSHTIVQEAMAHRSIRAGASLVVGNNQGAVQGIDFIEGVPVVYSTGVLLDGSTAVKTKTPQGILVRATFDTKIEYGSVSLTVIPIHPYGNTQKERNDYCPTAFLNDSEARKIIRQLWNDTADQFMKRVVFLLKNQK